MKSRDFCYWLQGFFEIGGPGVTLDAEQITMIKKHLNMVFVHEIDPSFPAYQQVELDDVHGKVSTVPAGDLKMRC